MHTTVLKEKYLSSIVLEDKHIVMEYDYLVREQVKKGT